MTDYLTEQEQIQQLKTWAKQYGPTVLLGVLIALAATYAWRYWQSYHARFVEKASMTYDSMLLQRAQNNSNETLHKADRLLDHYAKTPYADMAALMLARNDVLKKNYPRAIEHLQWAIVHSNDAAIREIARTRMARISIAEKRPDDALKTLKTMDDPNFIGLVDEIRGDAFVLKNNPSAAKKAYQRALRELPHAEVTRPILQMKFENLSVE